MAHFRFEGFFEDFCRTGARFKNLRILSLGFQSDALPQLSLIPGFNAASDLHTISGQGAKDQAIQDVIILSQELLQETGDKLAAECLSRIRPGGIVAICATMETDAGPLGTRMLEQGFRTVKVHQLSTGGPVAIVAEKAGPGVLEFDGERLTTSYSPNRRIAIEHLHRYALAKEICKGLAVLDVACGEGYGSALLGEVAASVVGVDRDATAVSHARNKHGGTNLNFLEGDSASLPIDDVQFDLVVSFETLEHLDDQPGFLREISRVLKPGGTLLISTPDQFEYSGRTGLVNPHHVRELTRKEFADLLAPHFSNIAWFGQRTVLGSWICQSGSTPDPSGGEQHATGPTGVISADYESSKFTQGPGEAVFWIALCGNGPLPVLPTGVALPEEAIHRDWLEAFELLESPQEAIEFARKGHLLDHRTALADRVLELEDKVSSLNTKNTQLKNKVAEGKEKVAKIRAEMARREEERRNRRWTTRLKNWLGRGK